MGDLGVPAHRGVGRLIVGCLLLSRVERWSRLLHLRVVVWIEWIVLAILLLLVVDCMMVASYGPVNSPCVLVKGIVAIRCILG